MTRGFDEAAAVPAAECPFCCVTTAGSRGGAVRGRREGYGWLAVLAGTGLEMGSDLTGAAAAGFVVVDVTAAGALGAPLYVNAGTRAGSATPFFRIAAVR